MDVTPVRSTSDQGPVRSTSATGSVVSFTGKQRVFTLVAPSKWQEVKVKLAR